MHELAKHKPHVRTYVRRDKLYVGRMAAEKLVEGGAA
jgi:hypothetical protein